MRTAFSIFQPPGTRHENIAVVEMQGGEIRGGTITNDNVNGIDGHRVDLGARHQQHAHRRRQAARCSLETAANDNDWDGTTEHGLAERLSGNLEIRDDATFLFTGTVSADNGREVFASDFELEFEPGSTLSLADGARYRSTNGTRHWRRSDRYGRHGIAGNRRDGGL